MKYRAVLFFIIAFLPFKGFAQSKNILEGNTNTKVGPQSQVPVSADQVAPGSPGSNTTADYIAVSTSAVVNTNATGRPDFANLDKNRNGTLSHSEFQAINKDYQMFNNLDSNRDGVINDAELSNYYKQDTK